MKQASEFSAILEKKAKWTPIEPQSTTVCSGADDFMSRALALRALEIPVGNFVESATKRDLPVDEIGLELLMDNIKDEIVHEQALDNLAKVFKPLKSEDEEEVKNILSSWLELNEHPISTARVIEAGVFFPILTMFRYIGDITARQVSADVSKDETLHVDTNYRICKSLGIEKCGRGADKLRRRTIAWLFEPLQDKEVADTLKESFGDSQKKFSDFDFWMTQSDNLCNRGIAPDLTATRNTRALSFFEIAKVNQPEYKDKDD